MVNTPYTRWTGDTLHGKRRILTSVWVRLAAICIRAPDAPLETVVTGLDMTGEVPGRLHGGFGPSRATGLAWSITRFPTPTVAATRCTWSTSSFPSMRCDGGSEDVSWRTGPAAKSRWPAELVVAAAPRWDPRNLFACNGCGCQRLTVMRSRMAAGRAWWNGS